jgi:condensin complex subunit 1
MRCTLCACVRQATASDKRGALSLLNMAALGDAQLLRCKLELLIKVVGGAKADLPLARHGCVALQRSAAAGPIEPAAAKAVSKALEKLLLSTPPPADAHEWYAAAEQAIGTLYVLSDSPEALLTTILRRMGAALAPPAAASPVDDELASADAESADADGGTGGGGGSVCSAALGRVLFCVGHVALKTLVHIEQCKKALDTRYAALRDAPAGATAPADELGAEARCAAAAEEAEVLDALAARLLEPGTLLGAWAPLVVSVCRNAGGVFSAELRGSASLTLCKLMCVSSDFCDQHLQLLFSIMAHEPEHSTRANVAIALGDLFFRHPNTLEPWTKHLYALLRDGTPRVRKNVLMVLMHLILNDMVKVRGGLVAELALCLIDTDERIASLAKLFFTEYAPP